MRSAASDATVAKRITGEEEEDDLKEEVEEAEGGEGRARR